MSKAFFVLLSLLPLLTVADNDWSKPCLDGWCSYDVPASETSMAGSVQISGSTSSISDITAAAGWEILNCTADADAQDIRLVCSGDDESCSHLFNNGAENTVVRLPPECGSVPFALVTSCVESDDQSMPEHVKSRIMRRDGTTPPVHTLSFNSNFSDISSSQHGEVSLFAFGSTIPGLNGNATITPAGSRRRSRHVNKRGIFGSFFEIGSFNETKSTDPIPINIDETFNIFNKTLSCSEHEEAKLSVDVEAKVNAEVTIGAVLAGSVIPPKIKEFGLFSDVSADLEGGLRIDANIAGEIDLGKVTLFSVGLPGFSIPKIFSLGPTFEIDAQALATIDLDVAMDVDLAYSFSNLQLFFPPSDGHPSSAVVAPQDTPLKLSASPNVQSNAGLEAHLIPTLKFGLNVFDGIAEADVFLDVDTFARLDLSLVAGASGSVDTTGTTDASAQVEGCVDINGGVSVNAGADGSLLGLFDANTQVSLFSKNFDFFEKCFEESTSSSSSSFAASLSTSSASPSSSSASLPSSDVTSLILSASGDATTSDGVSSTVDSTSSQPSGSAVLASDSIDSSTDTSTQTASLTTSIISSSVTATGSVTTSDSSSSTASATSFTSETVSSIAPEVTVSTTPGKGRPGYVRGRRSALPIVKRDFQCLAPNVPAPVSVAEQTVTSSSLA